MSNYDIKNLIAVILNYTMRKFTAFNNSEGKISRLDWFLIILPENRKVKN